jgi:tetratricopeptide (TPR) repeat protein
LWPKFSWAYFNRGLAYFRQKEYALACADFDKTLELTPELAEGYLNRALAHQALEHYAEAEADLTRALDLGFSPTRLYFLRSRVRDRRGNQEGARQDHAEGLRRPPTDEIGWVSRGYANIHEDPKAALADFEGALRLIPRSALGLQNKAHVRAEKMARPKEALEVLNVAVEWHPESTAARGGRGVLHARLGQRELARKDATETLARDSSPQRQYQVACIYALCAPDHVEDRLRALQLLSSALRQGYGFHLVDSDQDLESIRTLPEFRRLVDAARALQPASPPPSLKKS